MANQWLAHVKDVMKKNKGMKFKDVLKKAKSTYKKGKGNVASKPKTKKVKRKGRKSHRKRR